MLKKIKILVFLLGLLSANGNAQLENLKGVVIASGDVEGIHILNKSSVKYTVTDTDGSFQILAKAMDTLVFSGLRYELKEVFVTLKSLEEDNLRVNLEEKVTELDEVNVGRVLTGNIASDVGNIELKEKINFYDLGIPGYTGKPKTIQERKLYDANHGKMAAFYIIAGTVNINKLLNKISGRTKKLKAIVDLSESDKCMKRMKDFYSKTLFDKQELSDAQQTEYFYFCMDDSNFKEICERNDPTEVIPFLDKKLLAYKKNLNSKED
ncbi:MAG: hypothetical protein HKP48_10875 [Winogradskyella sp.]|uniref:carboxypeptidase-like regulatory domain-containing protein n=1 Tax=Winogradskyella sp. TaxID=1883156 RepID=UPI0017B28F45|nr:carboxypeptidase-like regulatory domain-containing protein [Winogradskyella sp.]MBT8244070.1 carboxypeptidase-like regulatory domain-containing protein [Winogradskyella sp.]NNK23763.1 hypothetical protein [Winogradskyella sp.]